MTTIQETTLEVLRARYRQEYDLSLRSPIQEGDDESLRETARQIAAAVLPVVKAAQRDAARGALDGLATTYRDVSTVGILQYRDARYPEEAQR